MQTRNIKGTVYNIFKDKKEFEDYFLKKDGAVPKLVKNWKRGKVGDWVLADDGGVVQIIKIIIPKTYHDRHLVYTPVGLFLAIYDNKKRLNMPYFMDTDVAKHPCPYRFNGQFKDTRDNAINKKIHPRDRIFAFKVAMGVDPIRAVIEVYNVKDVARKLKRLCYSKRVMKMIREDMRKIAKEKGFDDEYIFKKLDELINKSKDDRVTLDTIVQFGKIIGTIESEPKQTRGLLGTGFFHGFSQRVLEEANNVEVEEELEDGESQS